jgi:hypothetical protein
MLRTIAGVIVGYIAVVVVTIAGVFVSWAIFGAEGAFAPGSTVASLPWSITSCLIGFIAAIIAGVVAATIGKDPDNLSVKILAGLMLVLGLGIAVMTMGVEPGPMPAGTVLADMSFMEAGAVAVNPAWYNWVIPFIGAAGAFVGGMLVKRPGAGPF